MLLVMVPRLMPVVKRLDASLIFPLIRPGLAGGKNIAIPASSAVARKIHRAAFWPGLWLITAGMPGFTVLSIGFVSLP